MRKKTVDLMFIKNLSYQMKYFFFLCFQNLPTEVNAMSTIVKIIRNGYQNAYIYAEALRRAFLVGRQEFQNLKNTHLAGNVFFKNIPLREIIASRTEEFTNDLRSHMSEEPLLSEEPLFVLLPKPDLRAVESSSSFGPILLSPEPDLTKLTRVYKTIVVQTSPARSEYYVHR
jgi:hypothetical protein